MAIERMPSKIHTFTGRWIDPLDLKPEDVCVEDIAHHLSNQCRWSGACHQFYSVAQHAVLTSQKIAREFAFDALHHDDAEYVLQDMAKPLKNDPYLGQAYRGAEGRIEKVIAEVFGVKMPHPPEIREADARMLATEADQIMHGRMEWENYEGVEAYDMVIRPWLPGLAKKRFLARHYKLGGV